LQDYNLLKWALYNWDLRPILPWYSIWYAVYSILIEILFLSISRSFIANTFQFLINRSLIRSHKLYTEVSRAIAQVVSRRLPTATARVRAQVRSCGICGKQSGIGAVFSKYFCSHCIYSFHRLLHTHHLSSGAGTIGQLVADIPSGLSLTPPQETKKTLHRNTTTLVERNTCMLGL
jgi:hypothetical protein